VSRPGVEIIQRTTPTPRGAPTNTGKAFFVGITEKGSATAPIFINNMGEYITYLGARQTYDTLYDELETFFREGGAEAVVARVIGPTPVTAFKVFNNSTAVATLRIEAKNPGAWGNSLKVGILAGTVSGYRITVTDLSDVLIETSPDLADKAAAIAWSQFSNYVTASDPGTGPGTIPAVVATAALGGVGTDDHTNIVDANWATALAVLSPDLGPGQVLAPSRTTGTGHQQLLDHAAANNRFALLDGVDTTTSATYLAAAATDRALANAKYGMFLAPWVQVPGLTPGTYRDVPPSAFVAGLIARSDLAYSANVPAAGNNGQALFAVAAKATFTDAVREQLNTGGVNVIRNMFSGVRMYGWVTPVDRLVVPAWWNAGNVRLQMKIVALAREVAERHVFKVIDGQGFEYAAFKGDLVGILRPLYDSGDLYGDTPEHAFHVDTSAAINTPALAAAGTLKAVISLRMSPYAELVQIEIVKTAITEAVA
jgi:phage tail sheath protein FI